MDKITHLESIEDIRENDIWVFHAGHQSKYRVSGISDTTCTLIPSRENDNHFNNYSLNNILRDVNLGHCHIERDNQDSYRRVECKSGCGSFVLTPGQDFEEYCPMCRKSKSRSVVNNG